MIQLLRLSSYGFIALPLAAMALMYYVFLPKYFSETWGMPLATLGWIILVTRSCDAFFDPLVGRLLDEKHLSYERVLYFSMLPCALLFAAFYLPWTTVYASFPGASFFVLSIVFFLTYSCVSISYEGLGMRLSRSAQGRNYIMGVREGASLLGAACAGVLPAALGAATSLDSTRDAALCIAVAMVFCLPSILLWQQSVAGEKFFPGIQSKRRNMQFLQSAWKMPEFRILSLSAVLSGLSVSFASSLILYFVEFILESDAGKFCLAIYFVSGLFGMPLWVMLGKRWSKVSCFVYASLLNAGIFLFFSFLDAGDEAIFFFLVAGSGLGLGGVLLFPASLQADVIDLDEGRTGVRRDASFVALWSLLKKLAAAFGAGLSLMLLGFAGFQAEFERQDADVLDTLRVLYGVVPAFLSILAACCLFRLRKRHW